MEPEAPQKVEKHQLIHRYIYNEQTFQIEFNYDNNDSLLGITGAVESITNPKTGHSTNCLSS